jgi:ATP-binding cassette, subfamily B, multidrug efflux pump
MMMGHQREMFSREARKPKAALETLARLGTYFNGYWHLLVLVAVLVVVTTAIQVATPALTGQLVDCYLAPATQRISGAVASAQPAANCRLVSLSSEATTQDYVNGMGGLILLLVGLFVASAAMTGLQFFLMNYVGFTALRNLRVVVFKHIHRLSLGYFTKHEAGDVMSRITNDADAIQQVFGFPVVGLVQGILLIIGVSVAMISTSAVYAIISLLVTPLMFFATSWFSDKARQAFRKVRSAVGDVNANLQESFAAVREAQAFNREAENIQLFNESNAASRDASIRATAYTSALAPTLEALGYVSMAIVAGVGGLFLISGQNLFGTSMSLGLIIAFLGYTQRFNQPISQISVLWTNIQSAIAGAERIFGLLDTPPDLEDKLTATAMPLIRGRVEFEHVAAEYEPGELVLEDVNLVAEPGQTIAIVGPTGAGKTTIANLIPRFYDVRAGAVKIDGIDVRDVTAASLRSQIGVVLQDPFLFSDTVRSNIGYGKPDASEEQVVAAARLARADTFIERLPDGYDTKLGERGGGLSQGQRQLISIARAALANPRILILDEATSSVDTRTERLIQKALEELMRGRTSFVIAHRLSTIRNADQVLVLKDGQIIERGKHEELLRAGGFYYDLYMSQFRRDKEFLENGASARRATAPAD